MDRYRCKICTYIYDPKDGDVTAEIFPNTSFEDLPKSWICPDCGASLDYFTSV